MTYPKNDWTHHLNTQGPRARTHTLVTALSIGLAATWLIASPGQAHGPQAHNKAHHASPAALEQKDWGIAGDPQKVQRTIEIRMTDNMRFAPAQLNIRRGETVRLIAVNAGKVLHEIVIGTPQELKAHAEMMKKHPGMEHDEPYMAHVDPGQKGEIVWTFNRAGTFEFACLIPGHFEAGMIGRITVK